MLHLIALFALAPPGDDWQPQEAKYLKNIRTMERLARIQDQIATLQRHQAINKAAGEPTVSTEVQGIKVGDFVLITSPAEVLVEVGLNVKKASP